ncbi:ABC transporter permease [Pseudonocardia sp. WMMC193]|uniref:ABC transporter permease n=1 Tax=Pseudonocardia sp. WMMC193 TaxID=2911965 RepID=UPI001F1E282F|nr:ABC transporter permease [Pseudonocardia sp. WMMC193]MCF7548392.1 ABC transporter permease [Pseudonocardia sp. WMMC193]
MTAAATVPDLDARTDRVGVGAVLRRNRWWMLRVAVLPIHMLVFALLAFFLVRLIPGDPARQIAGPDATPETYLAVREQLGLDGSIWSQLGAYLADLLRLDLGSSITTGRPVFTEIMARLPGTVELAVLAFVALVLVSLLLSVVVVLRPGGLGARIVSGYSQAAGALPDFVVGVIGIFLFYATLRLVPAPNGRTRPGLREPDPITRFPLLDSALSGRFEVTSSILSHYLLPIAVLVVSLAPLLLKQLLGALGPSAEDRSTLFRVATGAPRRMVLASIYRRALPPTIAVFGTIFGTLLGGAVILEQLFGLGGLGSYAVDAVDGLDLTALQGTLVLVAAISMIVYLLVDLTTMLLDARRRPGAQGSGS